MLDADKRTLSMPQGTVKFFDPDRGFGFISRDDGDDDTFIHVRALQEAGLYSVTEGDRLEFELRPSRSKRGREEACEVRKIGSRVAHFGESR
jgi:cold shock protein